MRLVDETLQSLGEPVIAAGPLELAVHPLLNDDPMTVIGDDEAMQIKLEAVLHSGTVDLRYQAAVTGRHGFVVLTASWEDGGARGWLSRPKLSTMIMGPPQ